MLAVQEQNTVASLVVLKASQINPACMGGNPPTGYQVTACCLVVHIVHFKLLAGLNLSQSSNNCMHPRYVRG